MKNRISFLTVLLAISLQVFSQSSLQGNALHYFQDNNSDPYKVPTPNQSSLGTYGTIPVSFYTGKADVTVPIFETKQRGVNLDVMLSYDTSGLLINQLPGWTGHNWTLISGGAITRKINGKPDEINFHGTGVGKDVFLIVHKNDVKVMTDGLLDEDDLNYYNDPYSENYQTYWYLRGMKLEAERQEVNMYDAYTNYFNCANTVRGLNSFVDIRQKDTSADLFYFNFMGISGTFFFGNDGNWKVLCDQNIDVLFDVNDSTNYIESFEDEFWYRRSNTRNETIYNALCVKQPKTIRGFTLVDENGNRYIFGGDKNSIEYSMSLTGKSNLNTTEPWSAVSWMLKEVRDRFGNTLYSFEYSRGKHVTQIHNSYSSVTRTAKHVPTISPVHHSPKVCSATLSMPVYLDSIKVIDGTILKFNHSNIYNGNASSILYPNGVNVPAMMEATYRRMTYQGTDPYGLLYDRSHNEYMIFVSDSCSQYINSMNLEKLESIQIKHSGSHDMEDSVKTFSFTYDYNSRMHLTSVNLNNTNSSIYSYNFEYDRFDSIPSDYLTKKLDHWGYYNGIDFDTDTMRVVLTSRGGGQIGSSYHTRAISGEREARVADINFGSMGMLKKITFPTGGYSLLEYEQNTCSKYMSDDKQNVLSLSSSMPVGGLRIKSISNYDNEVLVGKKQYSYTLPNSTLSSGELYSIPNTHYQWEDDSYIYEVDFVSSVIPMSNTFAPNIGYSYVKETELDGSSKTFAYSNFSTEKDVIYDFSRFDVMTPFDENSCRQYMCGKLLEESCIDERGDTLQRTTYTYDTDQEYNYSHYVTTTSFSLHNIIGTVGSVHKLFYFKNGLKEVVSKTKFGDSFVTDKIEYDRRHRCLSIPNLSGQYHDMDVFQTYRETKSRTGFTLKTEYSYPTLDIGASNIFVSQFYFPLLGVYRYLNSNKIESTKTEYKYFDGKYLPWCELRYDGNSSIADTVRIYSSYTTTGRPQRIRDKDHNIYELQWNEYDKLQKVEQKADCSQSPISTLNSSVATYDNFGRVESLEKNSHNKQYFKYDSYGRLSIIEDLDHHPTSTFWYNYRTTPANN